MNQQRLKLPRKKKKFLKKGIWLYEADENGNSLSASPYNNQKDYLAFKEGRLRKLFRQNKNQRREMRKNLDKEITVPDEILYSYVKEIFSTQYRNSSYGTLIRAKHSTNAVVAYYNFLNAYNLYENGNDSYGNICCMAIDFANDLLKSKKRK